MQSLRITTIIVLVVRGLICDLSDGFLQAQKTSQHGIAHCGEQIDLGGIYSARID